MITKKKWTHMTFRILKDMVIIRSNKELKKSLKDGAFDKDYLSESCSRQRSGFSCCLWKKTVSHNAAELLQSDIN